MMKSTTITCDGCGATTSEEMRPDGWANLHVFLFDGNGKPKPSGELDRCARCMAALLVPLSERDCNCFHAPERHNEDCLIGKAIARERPTLPEIDPPRWQRWCTCCTKPRILCACCEAHGIRHNGDASFPFCDRHVDIKCKCGRARRFCADPACYS